MQTTSAAVNSVAPMDCSRHVSRKLTATTAQLVYKHGPKSGAVESK